ncbi:hypothetical protein ACWGQ5_56670 [Streptomyces sp. NPDC055722]
MDAICDPLDSDRSDLDSYIRVVHAFNARSVLDIDGGAVCDTRFRSSFVAQQDLELLRDHVVAGERQGEPMTALKQLIADLLAFRQ